MANDGNVKSGIEIDESGAKKEIGSLFDAVKKGFSVLNSAASAIAKVTEGALKTTVTGIAEAAETSIKAGKEFETSFAKTATLFGEVAVETDGLKARILELSNATGVVAVDLNKSLYSALSAGIPVTEGMGEAFDQIGAALFNITAAGTPAAQAAAQLDSLIAELGKQGTIGAKALEKAAQGTEYAGMSFRDMMEAGTPLNEVLDLMQGYAKEYGLSMTDLFSSIDAGNAAMAMSGENSQKFADNLAAMGAGADAVTDAYDKVSGTLEEKVERIQNSANNLGIGIYNGIQEPLNGLADMGLLCMDQLCAALAEGGLEGLVEAGAQIAADIGLGLAQGIPPLIGDATQLIVNLTGAISESLPEIINAGVQIIQSLATGIADNFPQIVIQGNEMIRKLGEGITVSLPALIQSGIGLIASLAEGMAQMLPELLQMAIDTVLALALSMTDPNSLLQLINAGTALIVSLANGLVEAIPKLIEAAPAIIGNLVAAVIAAIPQLLNAASEIMTAIGKYMLISIGNLLSAIPNIWTEIKRAFSEIDWASIGRNLIEGITTGVSAAALGLVESAVQAAKDAVQAVKNWLGIASPSKLMRDLIGKNMIAGIGVGIRLESGSLEKDAVNTVKNAVGAIQGIGAQNLIGDIQAEALANTVGIDRMDNLYHIRRQTGGQAEKPVFVLQKDSIKVEAAINGKTIAQAAAPYIDTELGIMQEQKERG